MLTQPVRRCCQIIKHSWVICQCSKTVNFLSSISSLRLLAHARVLQGHLSLQPENHIFLPLLPIHLKSPPGFQGWFSAQSPLSQRGWVCIHTFISKFSLMYWTLITTFSVVRKFFTAAVAECSHPTCGPFFFSTLVATDNKYCLCMLFTEQQIGVRLILNPILSD